MWHKLKLNQDVHVSHVNITEDLFSFCPDMALINFYFWFKKKLVSVRSCADLAYTVHYISQKTHLLCHPTCCLYCLTFKNEKSVSWMKRWKVQMVGSFELAFRWVMHAIVCSCPDNVSLTSEACFVLSECLRSDVVYKFQKNMPGYKLKSVLKLWFGWHKPSNTQHNKLKITTVKLCQIWRQIKEIVED